MCVVFASLFLLCVAPHVNWIGWDRIGCNLLDNYLPTAEAEENEIWWHKKLDLAPGLPTNLDHDEPYLVSERRTPVCLHIAAVCMDHTRFAHAFVHGSFRYNYLCLAKSARLFTAAYTYTCRLRVLALFS